MEDSSVTVGYSQTLDAARKTDDFAGEIGAAANLAKAGGAGVGVFGGSMVTFGAAAAFELIGTLVEKHGQAPTAANAETMRSMVDAHRANDEQAQDAIHIAGA
jgi:hypothetical protein